MSWLAGRRAIDAFYIREVDRDKIVLAGDPLDSVGAEAAGGAGGGPGGDPGDGAAQILEGTSVSQRSAEYVERARGHLESARLLRDGGADVGVIGLAYRAMLNAARGALSEEDVFSRTHRETWHLFHETLVSTGRFDPDLSRPGPGDPEAARVRRLRDPALRPG